MKIVKDEIRPVGFVTLELNENEVQTILGVMEENCYLKQRPFDDLAGTRGELYRTLQSLLTKEKGE